MGVTALQQGTVSSDVLTDPLAHVHGRTPKNLTRPFDLFISSLYYIE